MRIADNNFNLYNLDNRQDKLKPIPASSSERPSQEVLRLAVPVVTQVESVSPAQQQQLLHNYIQQPSNKGLDLGYPQQRAVTAYGQLAQQDERDKLQQLMGIDEYV